MKLFSQFKRGWMKFAHGLGYVNSRIILTIVFILFFGLYAIVMFLGSLFRRRKVTNTYWLEKKQSSDTLEALTHHF